MLNQRKNKRFSYKPRFKESQDAKSNDDLETKWNEVKGINQRKVSRFTSLPFLIILLVSLFVLIYILEGYIS